MMSPRPGEEEGIGGVIALSTSMGVCASTFLDVSKHVSEGIVCIDCATYWNHREA